MKRPEAQVGAVIAAAGSAQRMTGIDKVFATISGKPLLAYVIDVFQKSDFIDQIVIDTRAISSESIIDYEELRKLAEQWLLNDTNLSMDLNGDYTVNFLDFAIIAQN